MGFPRLRQAVSLLATRPLLTDSLLAALLLAWSLYALFAYRVYLDVVYRDGDALGVLLVGASTVPLVWRRRTPMLASLVISTASFLLGFLEYAAPLASLAVLLALYSSGAYASFRRGLTALAVATVTSTGYLLWFYANYPGLAEASPLTIFAVVIANVGLWALGRAVRNRRRYLRALEDRAERLERTRTAEVRAAVAEERARIARELHDVVAHHVSVMTVQAAAARRTLQRDPGRSREAMEAVEATGRAALVEMRRMVGVLRGPDDVAADSPAELAPQPGIGDLPTLVEQMGEVGLPVDLKVHGDRRQLAPGVDVTAFRVVQEALTNTLKHAGPAQACVDIYFHPQEMVLRVVDDGHGAATQLDNDRRPGHGLIGMRERVGLYGGMLQAGPRRGGGFEVTARLPLDPTPATKVAHEPADPRPAG